jgi:RHS repeat-associated protein
MISLMLVVVIFFTSADFSVTIASSDQSKSEYLIKFTDGNSIDSNLTEGQIITKFEFNNLVLAELTVEELDEISKSQNIQFIEENTVVTMESSLVNTTLLNQSSDSFHNSKRISSNKVKVGLLDTGVDSSANAFVAGGANFVKGSSSYEDDNGHGTYIASIISGLELKEHPVTELYVLKVLDDQAKGSYSMLIEATEWAIQNGMDIILINAGSFQYSQAMAEIVNLAYEKGILVISPVGDAAESTIQYPAAFNTVLAVGAVDADQQHYSNSNTGNEIDLVAQGVGVKGVGKHNHATIYDGTATAASIVTQIAAQYIHQFPNLNGPSTFELLKTNASPLGAEEIYGLGLARFSVNENESIEQVTESDEIYPGVDLPQASSQEDAGEDLIALGEARLTVERNKQNNERIVQKELQQLESEFAKLSIDDVINDFGVERQWIEDKTASGITLQELYSTLWDEKQNNLKQRSFSQSQLKKLDTVLDESDSVNHTNGSDIAESELISNRPELDRSEINDKMEAIEIKIIDNRTDVQLEAVATEELTADIKQDEDLVEEVEAEALGQIIQRAVNVEDGSIKIPTAKTDEAPYSVSLYGENVSMLSGGLSISESDMTLPGRNGMSFSLQRTYDSNNSQKYDLDAGSSHTYSFKYIEDSFTYAERYKINIKYRAYLVKYACTGSQVGAEVGTRVDRGERTEQTHDAITTAYLRDWALAQSKSRIVVHSCGSYEANRVYFEEYTMLGSSYVPYDVLTGSNRTTWTASFGNDNSAVNAMIDMINGSQDTTVPGGSYNNGYTTTYKLVYPETGNIYISDSTYYNQVKNDPLDNKFPLGKGWSWNVPYMKLEGGQKYVKVDGGLYEIEGTKLKGYPWSDLSFESDSSVTYDGKQSAYVLKSVYGYKQYFDSLGNVIQFKDAYNNTISFKYSNVSPYGSVLTSISDVIGNTLLITYESDKVKLQLGDRTVVYQKAMLDGKEVLSYVLDPMGRKTTYSYEVKSAQFSLSSSASAINNPYYLVTSVVHPTGVKSNYNYEFNPVTRYIGNGQFNKSYRIQNREDIISSPGVPDKTFNYASLVYTGDMASSYNQDYTFKTTLFNGLLETETSFKKDYIDSAIGSVYYDTQYKVSDGTTSVITEMTYDEAKRRNVPITKSKYYKNEMNQTTTVPVSDATVYDDYRNIIQYTNPFGGVSTFTFDSATHLLKNSTEAIAANQVLYTEITSRNAQGDVTERKTRNSSASGDILQHLQTTYDVYGNITILRNLDTDKTRETQIEYSGTYQYAYPTKISRPYKDWQGNTFSQEIEGTYNLSTGELRSITDGKDYVTTYQYDKLGRLIEIIHPDNSKVTVIINDLLNEVRQKDEEGRIIFSKWNELGLQTSAGVVESGVDKEKSRMDYDAFSRVKWTETALNIRSVPVYDSWNRVLSTTVQGKLQSTNEYADMSYTVISSDAVGNKIRQTSDRFERVIKKEELYNHTFRTIWSGNYNEANKLITEQDGKNRVTQYGYDALGQLLTVKGADQQTYTYVYNRTGLLTKMVYPDQTDILNTYDELGQLIQTKDQLGQFKKIKYDLNGNQSEYTDKKNQLFTFAYDNRNRLLNKSSMGDTISYTYDLSGFRKTMTDNTNRVTQYEYDAFTGSLRELTYPDGKKLGYTYNAMGNRQTVTTPFGDMIGYEYTALQQLDKIKWNHVEQADYSYNDGNELEEVVQANGLISQYNYVNGHMTNLTHKLHGQEVEAYEYAYDINGNLEARSVEIGVVVKQDQFTYDSMNRIQTSSQFNETYTYDNRGNRLTLAFENGLLLPEGASYEYDVWNRLTKVTKQDGHEVQYRYNGDNLMVERMESGVTTRYYYDEANIIAEATVSPTGTITEKASYLYGNSLLMREDSGQVKGYYVQNGHGDVVGIRSSTGSPLASYDYDIWGNTISETGTYSNPFRYSGELWDSTTKLQYLRARWYDPSIGRFITEDTYEGELTNPLSLNLYTYTANNPLKYIDPTGHFYQICSNWDDACRAEQEFNRQLQLASRDKRLQQLGQFVGTSLDNMNAFGPAGAEISMGIKSIGYAIKYIAGALKAIFAEQKAMKVINLGAGDNVITGVINTDIKSGNKIDLVLDATKALPYANESIDSFIAINPHKYAAINSFTTAALKPGGTFTLVGQYGNSWFKTYYTATADQLKKLGYEMIWKGKAEDAYKYGTKTTTGHNIDPESLYQIELRKLGG